MALPYLLTLAMSQESDFLLHNRKQLNGNSNNLKNYTITPGNSTLLEIFAALNNVCLGLFCCTSFEYIFQTSNHNNIFSDHKNGIDSKRFFMGLINNKKTLNKVIALETEITGLLTPEEKQNIRIFICGGSQTDKERNTKYLLQRLPFLLDDTNNVSIYLDSIRNITHLLVEEEGYWVRIKAGEKIFSWFSSQMKLLHHDIISLRETEVIKMWVSGFSISKIAEHLFISINTVKNHLKACRNRLLARDNTSLVQLCLLSDAIRLSSLS